MLAEGKRSVVVIEGYLSNVVIFNLALISINRSWRRIFFPHAFRQQRCIPGGSRCTSFFEIVLYSPFFVHHFRFSALHSLDLYLGILSKVKRIRLFEGVKRFSASGYYRKKELKFIQ